MSSERTYDQAIEEMTDDPKREYMCEGGTYRVVDGRLMFRVGGGDDRWFRSRMCGIDKKWYRLLSEQERDAAFYRIDMAKRSEAPPLNTCSRETSRPAQNPNPKKAFGAQKPDTSLIPPVAILHMAMAFEVGAAKYGAFNWRKDPVEAMTYLASQDRHRLNYLDGEDISSDDVHNLGQVMAACAIILDAIELGNLIDNRPPKGNSSQVQERMMAQKKAKLALVKKAV